jgi:hypothetical protein
MMETLRNDEKNLFALATPKEIHLANTEAFSFPLFTLCSARVSSLVIVLSDSPCERIGKWETFLFLKEDRSLVHV